MEMAGYLDQYGIGDERRGRIVKRTLLAILVALLVALALYLFFKDYPEEQAAKHFLSEVNAGQLQTAYQTWGCSEAHPCPNYIYEKFLEDWSKKSGASGDWTISKVEGCSSGVIVTVSAPGATSVPIWVQRSDKSLSFSPWPECQGKKWRFKQFFHRVFGGSK
jgi:hypothetical protein